MRHVALEDLIKDFFDGHEGKKDKKRLLRARKTLEGKAKGDRKKYIDDNGGSKWSPIKNRLTDALGNKCWYTEAELVGASLTIDHFRPSSLYWWLAFEVENYRVACPYSNSPKFNPEYGIAGGKGDDFPLLPPGTRATSEAEVAAENPIILDPCKQEDCELLTFQADGRPTINPAFAGDKIANTRVDESKILLNLDHPDFNTKREQLCNEIADDVRDYEYPTTGTHTKNQILIRMKRRLSVDAPFSMAARQYVRFYRHLDWIEPLLTES